MTARPTAGRAPGRALEVPLRRFQISIVPELEKVLMLKEEILRTFESSAELEGRAADRCAVGVYPLREA